MTLSHSDQEDDDEEEGVSTSAVTRFEQGCRAFRVAFLKIMNKKLPDDPLVIPTIPSLNIILLHFFL